MAGFALIVIVLVILIWIGAGLWSVTGTGDAWDNLGGGPWAMDHDQPSGERRPESDQEREDDLRASLVARNERRRTKGRPEVDVDQELAALTTPAPTPDDVGLEAEVRAHITARSERRVAAGKQPLDIEAEVARKLRGE